MPVFSKETHPLSFKTFSNHLLFVMHATCSAHLPPPPWYNYPNYWAKGINYVVERCEFWQNMYMHCNICS